MKFLAFIMSIFILALSIIPCADVDASSLKEKSNMDIHLSHNSHHENTKDVCSPFCCCSCCVGFTNHLSFQINPLVTVVLDMTYPYIEKRIGTDPFPLFQPPRV